jgi:DNA-binding GntR family transcriptional regulator
VLEALSARDADAAEAAMREHVRDTGANITAWMKDTGYPPQAGTP